MLGAAARGLCKLPHTAWQACPAVIAWGLISGVLLRCCRVVHARRASACTGNDSTYGFLSRRTQLYDVCLVVRSSTAGAGQQEACQTHSLVLCEMQGLVGMRSMANGQG
jgi:hypothetical protein